MERQHREQASGQYFELFGGLSDSTLAERLGVSVKTVGRLRTSANVPGQAVADAMQSQIDDVLDYAAMSDQQRIDAQEYARARREEHQRKIAVDVIEDGITRTYPSWMTRAVERYSGGQPDVAIDLLVDRVDPEHMASVDAGILPFALNLLASAYHATGRIVETIETLDRALGVIGPGADVRFDLLRRVIWSNLAAAHVRRKDYDAAFACIKSALKLSVGHAPAYYQAVHSASAQRDEGLLNYWLGRSLQAATTSMTPDDIESFITRAQTDPDFAWTRRQDMWHDFEREMLELRRSMTAQLGESTAQPQRRMD